MSVQYLPFLNELPLNSFLLGDQEDVTISGLAHGGFGAAWVDQPEDPDAPSSIRVFEIDGESGRSLPEFLVSDDGSGDLFSPIYAELGDGSSLLFYLVDTGDTIFVEGGILSDDPGAGRIVNPVRFALSEDVIPANLSVVPILGDRTPVLFDVNTEDDRVQAELFLPNLSVSEGPSRFVLLGDPEGSSEEAVGAALPTGGLVTTWSEGSDLSFDDAVIMIQRFDEALEPVAEPAALIGSGRNGPADDPAIAVLADGSSVIAWEEIDEDAGPRDHRDVFYRMFDATGKAFGDVLSVHSDLSGDQGEPSVVALPQGGFAVAWTDFSGTDGFGGGVFLRSFDAEGQPLGDAIQVNETFAGEQDDPVITVVGDGLLVASWEGREIDDVGNDVYLRLFLPETSFPTDGGGTGVPAEPDVSGEDDPESVEDTAEVFLDFAPDFTFVFGTAGSDNLRGGAGPDDILGYGGDDRLVGRGGNDELEAGPGDDLAIGGDGADTLLGASGNDRLLGQGGADMVFGGVGMDTLEGGRGRDSLDGGRTSDTLRGGFGDDTLDGGGGNDVLIGGRGGDSFHFGRGDDRIRDFDPMEDQLVLDADLTGGLERPGRIMRRFGEEDEDGVLFSFGDHTLRLDDVSIGLELRSAILLEG